MYNSFIDEHYNNYQEKIHFFKYWIYEWMEQAGAELGQAQLMLGRDLTSTSLHWIARKLVLLYSLSRPTFHFTPF